MIDRHQGQLVALGNADNMLIPAALPDPTHVDDLSIDEQAELFLKQHPRVLHDLIAIMKGYAAHPSCKTMPVRLAWEQLRYDYRTVYGLPIRLPNNFTRPLMERVAVVKPEWSGLLAAYVKKPEATA